jgi:cyclic di-GMP phosphodiesterase
LSTGTIPQTFEAAAAFPRTGVLVISGSGLSATLTGALALAGHRWESVPTLAAAAERLAGDGFRLALADLPSLGAAAPGVLRLVADCSRRLPVVLVAAPAQRRLAQRALARGAWGYALDPPDPQELSLLVSRALERFRLGGELEECRRRRLQLQGEVERQRLQRRRQEEGMIANLATALRFRDGETGAHMERIGLYAAELAESLGWGRGRAADLALAAKLHDVGKIGLPDEVLLKPAPLTPPEFALVKRHPEIGAEILAQPDLPLFRLAREVALSHHERWDGSGYPAELSGESIPESARIVAVADVYDALVHPRVYRPRVAEGEAVSWMQGVRDRFDPEVLACFLDLLPEMRRIRCQVADGPAAAPSSAATA